MKYSTIPIENRPPLNGYGYGLWRLLRARVEELPWIARRIVKANHLVKGYYDTPELWLANIDRAQTVAKNIRGKEYSPAIFVHGIMPRCGSNIVHDIIESQPTVIGREIGISEFPILCSSRAMDALYASVVSRHREVAENISGIEFMSFLVSGWLRDIELRIDEGNSAVLKMPSVQHLDLFHGLFPRDKL
jgi:protein-tyrosine sulfotransferase